MNLFTRVICLVLLVTALLFLTFQTSIKSQSSDKQKLIVAKAETISGDRFLFFQNTPMGVNVHALKRPNKKMLVAIDKGLDDLFAIAKKDRYRYVSKLNHSDYTIFIARADRILNSAKKYSPAIAVKAKQYAGSKYDQGGFIYAAGMVVAFDPCAFVIAEHDKEFQLVSDIVRYEGEHLLLYHNDRGYFKRTADHSKGGGHPILK